MLVNAVAPFVAPVCAYSPAPDVPEPPAMVSLPFPVLFTVIVAPAVESDDCTLPLLVKVALLRLNVNVLLLATVKLDGIVTLTAEPVVVEAAPPFKFNVPDVAVPANPNVSVPVPFGAIDIVPPVVLIVGVDTVPDVAPMFNVKFGFAAGDAIVIADAPVALNATVALLLLSTSSDGAVIVTAPPPDTI